MCPYASKKGPDTHLLHGPRPAIHWLRNVRSAEWRQSLVLGSIRVKLLRRTSSSLVLHTTTWTLQTRKYVNHISRSCR